MKKSLYLLLGILLICGIYQACAPDVELPGSIYGVVADKATGEPIKSAGVELSPGGLKTITGSEGQFEFTELDPGKYTLLITKTGYIDGVSSTIEVKAGQQAKGDVQLEKLPPSLRVVNDKKENIDTLDFGFLQDDVARSFNLFNDGVESLEWQITTTAEWIKSVSKMEGVLSAGATQSLIVTIDRAKLHSGENTTIMHITSNNGSKQLTIIAIGPILATLNTLAVTNIKTTSATLNGEIITDGSPKYSERGFVYSESPMPTIGNCIHKVASEHSESKTFSASITGLVQGKSYYVRAYAINTAGEAYSVNEVAFIPDVSLPKVETVTVDVIDATTIKFIGNILDAGDPEYTERGFIYASSNTTLDEANAIKVGVPKTSSMQFEKQITIEDLGKKTYYVCAYSKNSIGIVYGKTLNVDPEQVAYALLPTFIYNNTTYRVYPELGDINYRKDWYEAKSVCENITYGGYDDWILPSIDVLSTMYFHKKQIGLWTSKWHTPPASYYTYFRYWSSTEYEYSSGYAYQYSFYSDGERRRAEKSDDSYDLGKDDVYYRVRCVRKEN